MIIKSLQLRIIKINIIFFIMFLQCANKFNSKNVQLFENFKNDEIAYIGTCKISDLRKSIIKTNIIESSYKDSLEYILKSALPPNCKSTLYKIPSYGQVAAEFSYLGVQAFSKGKDNVVFRTILNRYLEKEIKEKILVVGIHYGVIADDEEYFKSKLNMVFGTVEKVFPEFNRQPSKWMSGFIMILINTENHSIIEIKKHFLWQEPDAYAIRKHVNYILNGL